MKRKRRGMDRINGIEDRIDRIEDRIVRGMKGGISGSSILFIPSILSKTFFLFLPALAESRSLT
jgi:hypothetical protein